MEKDRIWTQLNPDRCFPEHVMGLEHPLYGWPELAQLMAQNADLQAFPAFTDLNVKSLLYYQAELTDLREELRKLEWTDHLDGRFRFSDQFCARVDSLLYPKRLSGMAGPEGAQLKLVFRIRAVLKEYSMNYSSLSSFSLVPFNSRARRRCSVCS